MTDRDADQQDDSEFERIADAFADSCARGPRPAIEDYCARYPDHAEQIRELFPVILEMQPSDASPAESPELISEELDDFQLIREIGRGGMGVVYEAHQRSLGRRVALKVLPATVVAGQRQRQRFELESRAAARLHHSNIVPVYGVGEHDGVSYYVMQYIEGCGLDEIVREVSTRRSGDRATSAVSQSSGSFAAVAASWLMSGSLRNSDIGSGAGQRQAITGSSLPAEPSVLPQSVELRSASTSGNQTGYLRNMVRLGVRVADALQYAHSQGILHRDIKPSNLMLDGSGQVWVMDFGLAKAEDSGDLTRTGDVVGTLRYMAPERFRGVSDPRSDVYSLGLTLYELLLLRPAFDAADRDRLIHQLATATPPRPRKLDRSFPRDLETILMRACRPEPAGRYASAADLRDDLQRFLEGRTISARRASLIDHGVKWMRRQPVISGLTMTTIISVVLGICGVTWQWRQAVRAQSASATSEASADKARTEAEQARDDLYSELFVSDLQLAHSSIQQERRSEAVPFLRRHLPSESHPDLREFGWRHLWSSCHQGQHLTKLDDSVKLCISETEDQLYILESWSSLQMYHLRTGERQKLLDGPWTGMELSPDRSYLALRKGRTTSEDSETLWLFDTQSHEIVTEVTTDLGSFWSFTWTRDSDALLLCGMLKDPTNGRGQFLRWDVDSRGITSRFEQRDAVGEMACMPDTGHLVISSRGQLEFRDPETLELVRSVPTQIDRPKIKSFRDGRTLVAVGWSSHAVHILDAMTGEVQQELSGHKLAINATLLMNNERQLLTASGDGVVRLWDLQTSELLHTYLGHSKGITSIVPLDDRQFITASYDGEVRHCSIDPLSIGGVTLPAEPRHIRHVTWSRDASMLYIALGHQVLRLEVATGKFHEPWSIPGNSRSPIVGSVRVTSDGRVIIGVDEVGQESREGAIYMGQEDSLLLNRIAGRLSPVNRLVVSTDDRLAATTPVSYSPGPRVRSCHVVDLLTGAVSATFSSDPGGTFHSAVFSNDSTRFYLGNSDTIRVFDTESWEEMDRLVRPEPPHDGGSFTGLLPVAENHSVLITRSDGELVLWTPGESFPAWTGTGHLLFVHEITGDANGQQFFTQGFDRTVRLWKIDRETPLLTFPLDPLVQRSDRYGLALSHSGNRLAAIEGPQQIKILTAADDDKVELNLSVPTP